MTLTSGALSITRLKILIQENTRFVHAAPNLLAETSLRYAPLAALCLSLYLLSLSRCRFPCARHRKKPIADAMPHPAHADSPSIDTYSHVSRLLGLDVTARTYEVDFRFNV